MKVGEEYASLVAAGLTQIAAPDDIVLGLKEIQAIRKRPIICYAANVINAKVGAFTAIDNTDDLPFDELLNSVDATGKALDIVLVTPGGSAQQVAKFVDKIRAKFDDVAFIILQSAMSAGTIFATSGNDIIMGPSSYLGPTDPQGPNRDGVFVPLQGVLTVIQDIQDRGKARMLKNEKPDWTDVQILNRLDAKEIGNAIQATAYSKEMVENYLHDYKFKNWTEHQTTKVGIPVTPDEKRKRAGEIAERLARASKWKSHSRGIPRDVLWSECELKITHAESIKGLDVAMRRLWAVMHFLFERTSFAKLFISESYSVIKLHDPKTATK